jgi:glycogenin glucosyltransferase
MWYQVPDIRPSPTQMPKPIFPWEKQADRPRATRVFADDPPEPTQEPAPASTHPFSTVHYEEGSEPTPEELEAAGRTNPPRVASPKSPEEQWQSFGQTGANAWDAVPGIDTYVRAIFEAQNKRGKPQAVQHSEVSSPILSRKNRRESLILTDFPSALERPSLPVTPAPRRRPTFWGEDRDGAGDLPTAEGVPDQADWVCPPSVPFSATRLTCPQCGFSSVNTSDFQPHRESLASTATVIATPSPSAVYATAAESPLATKAAPPSIVHATAQQSPSAIGTEAETSTPVPEVSPSKTLTSPPVAYKSGVSPRGAPLASLTDMSLFAPAPPTHFPGLSPPAPAAST